MCRLFDAWQGDIEQYCQQNGLDFQKAKRLPQSWGKNDLCLHYVDKEKGKLGLKNETPAKIVLMVFKENGKLRFEQTEHTRKYLS